MRWSLLVIRWALFLGVLSSYIWVFWGQKGEIGSFTETRNGMTHVSAGTNPPALVMGVSMLLIYFVLLNTRVKQHKFRVAPIWRRAAAFAVDFWCAIFTIGALSGCVDVLLEAFRTGSWRWHFERDYSVASDSISLALVFLFLAAFVAYFLLPLMYRGQTVGNWIFRLVTVNSDGSVVRLPLLVAIRRLFASFRGLGSPLRTIRKRDGDGQTFYDIESGFTVVSY